MNTSPLRQIRNVIKGNNHITLLVFNFVLFMVFLSGIFIADFSLSWLLISFGIYFLMICCGVSTTYHRSLTHKAFLMPKWLERTFVTFACMAGTGSPIMWVMTHRQHHVYSDKEGDPHPPSAVYKTIFGVYPRVKSPIRDIVRDKYYKVWHKNYFGILTLWVLFVSMFGFNPLFFIVVLPVVASIFVSNALNWYGHKESSISYRNYNLRDHSQNNWVMAVLAFGEGWHNNHHRHPGSAKFGVKSHEYDVSFMLIKLLSMAGLATNIKYPNKDLM